MRFAVTNASHSSPTPNTLAIMNVCARLIALAVPNATIRMIVLRAMLCGVAWTTSGGWSSVSVMGSPHRGSAGTQIRRAAPGETVHFCASVRLPDRGDLEGSRLNLRLGFLGGDEVPVVEQRPVQLAQRGLRIA